MPVEEVRESLDRLLFVSHTFLSRSYVVSTDNITGSLYKELPILFLLNLKGFHHPLRNCRTNYKKSGMHTLNSLHGSNISDSFLLVFLRFVL